MTSIPMPARPLVDPVDGVAAAVAGHRWVLPMIAVVACVSLSAVAVYLRWDASPSVISELTTRGKAPA